MIAILAILAAIAIPGVVGVLERTKYSADRTSAKSFENAIKLHLVAKANSGQVAALPTSPDAPTRIANAITKELGNTTSFVARTDGWHFYVETSSGRVVAQAEPAPDTGWVALPAEEVTFREFTPAELP